jgi:hypothetical protein
MELDGSNCDSIRSLWLGQSQIPIARFGESKVKKENSRSAQLVVHVNH